MAGVPATEHQIVAGDGGACRVEVGMLRPAVLYAPLCVQALSNLARTVAEERRNTE